MGTTTNAALELLEHNLRDRPDQTVYLCNGRPHTYRELGEKARWLAHDTQERAARIGSPALVLAGLLPRGQFQCQPGGHAFLSESTGDVARSVLEFLVSVRKVRGK